MALSASAPQRVPENDRVLGRRLDGDTPHEPLQRPIPVGHAPVSYDRLHDATYYHASRLREDLSATRRLVPGQPGAPVYDDMLRAFKEQTARYDQGAQRTLLRGSVGQPRVVESGNTLPLDVATTRSADAHLGTVAPSGKLQHQRPLGHHEDPLRQLVAAYARGPTTHIELERRALPPTLRVARSEARRAAPTVGGSSAPYAATVSRVVPISTAPTRRIRHRAVVRASHRDAHVGADTYADIGALRAPRRRAVRSAPPQAAAMPARVGPVRPSDVRGSHAVGLSVPGADRAVAYTSNRHDVALTSSRSTPAGTAREAYGTRRRHAVDPVPVAHTDARRVSAKRLPVTAGASHVAAPAGVAATASTVRRITDNRAVTSAPNATAVKVHAWRDGEATSHRAGVAFPPRLTTPR